jgi:hypothetical protein
MLARRGEHTPERRNIVLPRLRHTGYRQSVERSDDVLTTFVCKIEFSRLLYQRVQFTKEKRTYSQNRLVLRPRVFAVLRSKHIEQYLYCRNVLRLAHHLLNGSVKPECAVLFFRHNLRE